MAITMPGKDVPVRLISYLTTQPDSKDTTYVLGGFANAGSGAVTVLRQLAHADDESTIFYADSRADPLGVRLYWGKDRSQFICWGNVKDQCFFTSNKNMLIREASILAVAPWRTEPWLMLSDWNDRRTLDVAGSKTDDKTAVLGWPRNRDGNQVWRIEPVKP